MSTLTGHTDEVWALAFSPDGATLASGGLDDDIRLWDIKSHQCYQKFSGHSGWTLALTFSPDGAWLATGGSDHRIYLWNVAVGKIIQHLIGHSLNIEDLAFSPDGQYLASGSGDTTIRLWDMKTHQCHKVLKTPGPYEGLNITSATGLTAPQRAALKDLGAINMLDL